MTGKSVVTGPRETWPDERAMARAEANRESFELLRREQESRMSELPKATDLDRLPLEWYKAKVRQLKDEAKQRGIDGGIFLTNRWNVIYASGLLHTTTERPFACFFPMDQEDACIWFYPHLDDAMVKSWWCTEGFGYFDFQHAEGSAPNAGIVTQGDTFSIHRWWGELLSRLGYGNKTIGIDIGGMAEIGIMPGQEFAGRLNMFGEYTIPQKFRPVGGSFGVMASAMPEAQFVDVADILIRHRMVKDDMENALTQRAMNYFSEIHAFARNYILEKGIGVLDWEVANAAREWGMHLVMKDIKNEGYPHEAVGIDVRIGCRTGRLCAYPHPNQIQWARVEPGHSLQISGVVRIGGYGGEQYRSFLIAPWTDWQEHVWDVHTATYYIQARESYAGNTCSNVAKAVHDYQVKNGVSHLVYHRPGHGEGMEGHQPPYQALGDYTVMQKGMHFSNEPGLFDPENGFGFNHGNNILVWNGKGLQMGTAPCDKQWCLLKL
ncbi:MAG: M24 family metallopeptidase [Bacillota bacterium]|jgi:Xaa-Pro dipeptidase